jgi:hypothetical protein
MRGGVKISINKHALKHKMKQYFYYFQANHLSDTIPGAKDSKIKFLTDVFE